MIYDGKTLKALREKARLSINALAAQLSCIPGGEKFAIWIDAIPLIEADFMPPKDGQLGHYLRILGVELEPAPDLYTETIPTKPGWYFVEYTGVESHIRRVTCSYFDFAPDSPDFTGKLCKMVWCNDRCSWIPFDAVDHIHEDTRPMLFAGPIPMPRGGLL